MEYHKLIEVCYLIMVLKSVARKPVDDWGPQLGEVETKNIRAEFLS